MTPKLTRPYVLQPVANGIALFPLEMVHSGALDFAKIRIFNEMEASYEYTSNPEKLLAAIRTLIENGDSDPEVTEIHQIPTDTP